MGQEMSEPCYTFYVGCGKTFLQACNQLEMVLRCYVNDNYRVSEVKYSDFDGKETTIMVALSIQSSCYYVVKSERHKYNGMYGARVRIKN